MAATIPVSNATVLSSLNLGNLSSKTDILAVLTAHQNLVKAYLAEVLTEDDYDASIAAGSDDDTSRAAAVAMAYCYIMGAKTLHLLNLSSSGKGIIQKTGIDERAAAVMSQKELDTLRKHFYREALEIIADYLSSDGLVKQAELKETKAGLLRAELIGSGDNDLPWWYVEASTEDSDE